ncbi:hypothetical protein [Staphylococcus warneri]|uniref:hypothetical protein n=1 Tax=Staphylococcus warneri TaxID=1292 RepID=UPI001642BBF0|nr:hypothetical protein [Staphylococcus warneri]
MCRLVMGEDGEQGVVTRQDFTDEEMENDKEDIVEKKILVVGRGDGCCDKEVEENNGA